jgi:putative phage-type endonuclease
MLNAIIDDFVALYESNAKQRSDEWYQLIKSTVGGSDMGVIAGVNPYKCIRDFIKERVGDTPFSGNLACWWGTVFEDIIARIIELDCNTSVKGAEITITNEHMPGIRFSPDGYCVVRMHNDGEQLVLRNMSGGIAYGEEPGSSRVICDDDCEHCRDFIALVEIKCPLRRKPNESIPPYYVSQIHSGLCFSPIAHFGMFTEAVIRKRGLYNVFRDPLVAWGIIGIYGDESHDAREVDLGCVSCETLEWYLKRMCGSDAEFTYEWGDPSFERGDQFAERDRLRRAAPAGRRLVAVLPWIAEQLHNKFVERNTSFLQELVPDIRMFHKMVNEARAEGSSHRFHPDYVDPDEIESPKRRAKRELSKSEQDFYGGIELDFAPPTIADAPANTTKRPQKTPAHASARPPMPARVPKKEYFVQQRERAEESFYTDIELPSRLRS